MTRSLVSDLRDVKERLSNGNNALRVHPYQEPGDSWNVQFATSGIYFELYGESLALASLTTTDILSYTVPVGKVLTLQRIDFSSENKSIMEVKVNNITKAKKRTWFVSFDGSFVFENYKLVAGDIVKLTVENKTNSTANFNANIQGKIDDA